MSHLCKKKSPPSAKQKLSMKYPEIDINWEKAYSLPFQVTPESKVREFQYKIANDIVFTNEKLFRFGLTQSPNCAFCQEEPESIEHLLFLCKVSSDFWKHVLSWLRDNNISIMSLDVTDVIFGKFDIKEDFLLLNHLLLLGKYYLYVRKCNSSFPSLAGFIVRTRRVHTIELHNVRERGKLTLHLKKWEKLSTIFS